MAGDRSIPSTKVLMIDLDITVDGSWLRHYRRMVQRVLESYGLKANAIRITPSRNRGYHVRIYLNKPVPAETANMLQLLLLDDHGRVDFNRARIKVGFPEWDKLFEKPRG
jgi:hypothetical protein